MKRKFFGIIVVAGALICCRGALANEGGIEYFAEFDSALRINALAAGHSEKVDGKTVSNNWDFIELVGVPELELDGYEVKYTRSSGTSDTLVLSGVMTGEVLLLRYKGSPQKDGDFFYGFDLAVAGGKVEILKDGEVVDMVAWGSVGENDGRFGQDGYYPVYDAVRNGWKALEVEEPKVEKPVTEELVPQCLDLLFSEIYSYFETDYAEQFVEMYNPTDETIELSGCVVKYKNKNYEMSGTVGAGGYLAYRNVDLKLTKNPTSSNYVELVDVTGRTVASAEWHSGQKKGVSVAWFGVNENGVNVWAQTYAVTPGGENIWQEYKNCPSGKVINPATGNCIGIVEDEPLPECPAGKFRNPETNRCKSLETVDSVLAPCAEGSYRNPETNRCKKLTEVTGLTPCLEGYERNPETNRCRKIRENEGADYAVPETSYGDKVAFAGYWTLAVIGVGGVGYVGWQFRREICKAVGRVVGKVRGVK